MLRSGTLGDLLADQGLDDQGLLEARDDPSWRADLILEDDETKPGEQPDGDEGGARR